jgi:hypothetical protein
LVLPTHFQNSLGNRTRVGILEQEEKGYLTNLVSIYMEAFKENFQKVCIFVLHKNLIYYIGVKVNGKSHTDCFLSSMTVSRFSQT